MSLRYGSISPETRLAPSLPIPGPGITIGGEKEILKDENGIPVHYEEYVVWLGVLGAALGALAMTFGSLLLIAN